MRQVAKTLGRNPKELDDMPDLRDELNYLWALFVSLKNAASGSISYNQIQAYMAIYGNLTPFEVDLVRYLDTLYTQENNDYG